MNDVYSAYWQNFVNLKVAQEYYFLYVHHSRQRSNLINGFCMVMSFTGVVTLVNNYLPTLAASLIVLIAQIISILQPLYPFGNRLYASNRIYKGISGLTVKAERTINEYLHGDCTEEMLSSSLTELQAEFPRIEEGFADPELFPHNRRLHKKAEQNVTTYIQSHFWRGD